MGYDSFDGGSHSPHQWVVAGHEKMVVFPEPEAVGDLVTVPWGTHHYYVVRACQLCEAVWWQEYDSEEARAA